VHLEATGHLVAQEAPERLAAAILAFTGDIEARHPETIDRRRTSPA
jgi:hypothetical protein